MKICSILILIFFISGAYSQRTNVWSIAHRGASGTAPENTLASFKKALDLKADLLELDVHQTSDSVLVVIHDKSIDRTTDRKGAVRNLTLNEIKKADAGFKFGKDFAGEKIPTLEEVIQLVEARSILFIEIKKGGNYYPGIEKSIVDLLRKYHAYQWCYVQSNDKQILKKILEMDSSIIIFKSMLGKIPLIPVYIDKTINSGGILEFPGAKGFTIHHRMFSKKTVKKIHDKGRLVFAWTVNDENRIKKVSRKGVDGIITNFPERITKQ